MKADDFVARLVKYLNMKALWVGSDFALGYQREGNAAFLKAQGQKHGFAVTVIELMMTDAGSQVIRSSQVRDHVRRGSMENVKAWLGPGLCSGGRGRARTKARDCDWLSDRKHRSMVRANHPSQRGLCRLGPAWRRNLQSRDEYRHPPEPLKAAACPSKRICWTLTGIFMGGSWK